MTAKQLQKKHPKFIYEKFSYSLGKSGLACKFRFKLEPNIFFRPEILIKGVGKKETKNLPAEVLENFVFHIGLAEIPSYWKCAGSQKIEIKAARINEEQIKWWEGLLLNGLAEFFYKNGINPKNGLFKIVSTGRNTLRKETKSKGADSGLLVPVGGGKDSLVALKLIQATHNKIGTMVLGNVKASYNLIKSLELKPPIKIERKIDKKLLALNKKGYLNGHTPFSAYLAFLSIFCARLFGYGTIVAGNERSANEPNISFGGKKINHQYSKSYEFEKNFRAYAKKYLTENVSHFSILRPLYELQIAKLAAKYSKSLAVTRSCNVNMKKNSWCGKCPKCLSVYILLYPFLGAEKTKKMFGKDLFGDKNLWKYIPGLIGDKTEKPFDCVATRKENMAALDLAVKKSEKKMPYVLKKFRKSRGGKTTSTKEIEKILLSWDNKNFLPTNIKKILKNTITTFSHS